MWKEVKDLELNFNLKVSTKDLEPKDFFPKQERLKEAFETFLAVKDYNLFVVGPEGVGKTTYTLSRLEEERKKLPPPEDLCYYHNPEEPLRPKLLVLPNGQGRRLKEKVERVLQLLKEKTLRVFESKEFEEEKRKRLKVIEEKKQKLLLELSQRAQESGLFLLITPTGFKVLPTLMGRPIPEEEALSNPALKEQYQRRMESFEPILKDYLREIHQLDHKLNLIVRELRRETANYLVSNALEELFKEFPRAKEFLKVLKELLIENIHLFLEWEVSLDNPLMKKVLETNMNLFKLHLFVDSSPLKYAPLVYERLPTFKGLFGFVSYKHQMGFLFADHTSLVPGSIHRARGGFLVLRSKDLLLNPILYHFLKRSLLKGEILLEGGEDFFPLSVGISPEPVDFKGKVVLLGDNLTYLLLKGWDEDFSKIFKIKAEFNPLVEIDEEFLKNFPNFLKKLVEQNRLKDLNDEGVSEVLRVFLHKFGTRKRVFLKTSFLEELLKESNLNAKGELIGKEEVRRAYRKKYRRENLIEERIRSLIEEGKIKVEVEGERVGQVNGLSVYDFGEISFAIPVRITCVSFLGERGIINIEREINLSGPIHSKGFLHLIGYLGHTYGREVPLSFSAIITFEQSYDEVEGDSASLSELLSLLSSLSQTPLRQDLAVTGSIDQFGRVQPVGGVREKVEGFFYTCKAKGLTGTQGVIIPKENYEDLVLAHELLEEVKKGRFHLYLVESVDDAIELVFKMSPKGFHRKVKGSLVKLQRKLR